MTAKEFVKKHRPEMVSERHVAGTNQAYWLILEGKGTPCFASGETELFAWKSAKRKIEEQKQHIIDIVKADEESGLYDSAPVRNISKTRAKLHEVDLAELEAWMDGQEVTYASSSRENKRLVVTLDGLLIIYAGGKYVWSGEDAEEAVNMYNSITEKYIDPNKDFKL